MTRNARPRGSIVTFAFVVLIAPACGRTDGTAKPSASPVVTPTAATTTSSAATSTSPAEDAAILLGDGVGEVRFGDPIDEALAWFEERFGSPDRVRSAHDAVLWGYLSEGLDVDGRIRIVTWGRLQVVFLDRSGEIAPDALPFAAWTMGWGEGDGPGLTTPEGIGLGSTRADLEAAYGDALSVPTEPGGPCGISWVFEVDTDAGPYRGTFAEEPRTPDEAITSIGAGARPSC